MEVAFIPLCLLAGALLAVQAGSNTQLSRTTGSPLMATALQLLVGMLVLTAIASVSGTLRAVRAPLPEVPWWHAVGGAASAFYIVSTILLFPRLGAAVTAACSSPGRWSPRSCSTRSAFWASRSAGWRREGASEPWWCSAGSR